MAFPQGIYFRSTDNQVDPTNYDCIAGGTTPGISYPFTTAQGNTVGWEAAPGGARDRGGAGAVELRGLHFAGTVSKDFRIDLPATGSYNIRAAFGDQTTAASGTKATFSDTTTVFATPVPAGTSIASTHFIDANGTDWPSQNGWTVNNVAISRTFSTTIFRVNLGGSTGNAPMAALYIESAGGVVDPPFYQTAWSNPLTTAAAGFIAAIAAYGTLGTPAGYASSDAPFAQRHWPNPQLGTYGFQAGISQRPGRLTALLPVFVQPPINQYNWPNPVLRLKTFDTQPIGSPLKLTTLAGKDLVPFHTTEWPNPRGPFYFSTVQIVGYPAIFRSDGQPTDIWTPVPPTGGTWTPETDGSDIWTPVTPSAPPWA